MSIDSRDIPPIATVAETAAKVLRERGHRAWKSAENFDPGSPTSRPPDAASGGIRVDKTDDVADDLVGLPVIGTDPVGDAAIGATVDGPSYTAQLRTVLSELDRAAQRAIDLVDELTKRHTVLPPEDPRGWCPTCRRAGVTEPSAVRTDGSQRLRDREGRCRPCGDFVAQHGFERPGLIIQRKAEGRKLSKSEADQAIARARQEHDLEQRKAAARLERKRTARASSSTPADQCPSTLNRNGTDHRCGLDGAHNGPHLTDVEGRIVTWTNHGDRAREAS